MIDLVQLQAMIINARNRYKYVPVIDSAGRDCKTTSATNRNRIGLQLGV